MKKIVLISALAVMLSINVAAYAADTTTTAAYTGGSANSAKVADATGYSTVIITKDNSNDPLGEIVYINQTETGFTDFLLKENPSVGKYNIMLGNIAGDKRSATFYIGVNSEKATDTPMTRLSYTETQTENSDTYYTAGFYLVTDLTTFNNFNSIKVGYNNGNTDVYGGFPRDNDAWHTPIATTGGGEIKILFVLDHIENHELDSVSVFLSPDELQSGAEVGSAYKRQGE